MGRGVKWTLWRQPGEDMFRPRGSECSPFGRHYSGARLNAESKPASERLRKTQDFGRACDFAARTAEGTVQWIT
jgi:hypothetical protein